MACSTISRVLVAALAICSSFVASQPYAQTPAQSKLEESRGALLYNTHCISCHTTQMHWRNNKQAFDWGSLKVQVRRWQANAGLQWGEADIDEVSRYLNETIYRYPTSADRVGLVLTPTHLGDPHLHIHSQ